MSNKKIIFFGGIGRPGEFGGELSKNKLIISRLEELGYEVVKVDTNGASRHPWKLLRFPLQLMLTGKNVPVVFSTSFFNIRHIVKLLHAVSPARRITYWAIGGRIAQFIRDGHYHASDFRYFSNIFVEGSHMMEELASMGLPGLQYVPNFKRLNALPDASEKQISASDTLRCVFLSRIIPEKGVRHILDACESMPGENFNVDFYGTIAPDFKDEFMQRVSQLPNARYRGTLNFFSPSGLEQLSKYHLSLFPTHWIGEGFPGVIIDSMAASVPVLASDWSFNREVLNQQCSFIYENATDGASFARAFKEILDNRTRLNSMFPLCRDEALRYDVRRIITPSLAESLLGELTES